MQGKIKEEFRKYADSSKAEILQKFFKTGFGGYGEGDVFLGLTVPKIREIAQKYHEVSFGDIKSLLRSKIHEERFAALLILIHNFQKANKRERERLYGFYLGNTKYINNWDLVDLSAAKIVGEYLLKKVKKPLYILAKSKNLWGRRIAIIATAQFIKSGDFKETLKIAKMLLQDPHDLIQKAVGWMLREVGNRSFETERNFLEKHYKEMPRTMLRYAIEHFPEKKRKAFLA